MERGKEYVIGCAGSAALGFLVAMILVDDPSDWWEPLTALGTLAAAVAAVGVATWEHFQGKKRERHRQLTEQVKEYDEVRRLILSGAKPIDDGRYATIVNALRWHSGLIADDRDERRFKKDWEQYNAWGSPVGRIEEILEELTAREQAARAELTGER